MPAELTPADPEIRELLQIKGDSCNAENPAARTEKVEKALQIADTRGLIGDKALIEGTLASNLITQGNWDQAFVVFRKALQDSIDSQKEVLEADILISLAAEAQMKGNTQDALALVTRALSLTDKTGSLYERAHALGELGRLKLVLGKTDEASSSIDEALTIDRLNKYKFEALHLLYRGYYLGLKGNDSLATETMKQARDEALVIGDYYSFVQAESSYAFGLARSGKANEAVGQMGSLRARDLSEFVHDASQKTCLAATLDFPMIQMLVLEGFTNVLEAANEREKEIEVWQELFSIGEKHELLAAQAEAKQKAADLENQLKRSDEALKDYAAAADLYRKLGNEVLLNQVQVAESVLLVRSGRGKDAVPIVDEIVSYAKQHSLRQLEFRSYITLAGIFQPAGQLEQARDALESAISLVHPGPFDDEIDDQTVHLAYVSLADIYRALKVPPEELLSIDRAFFVSFHLKDEKGQQHEVTYLDQRLNELHTREQVEEQQKEGHLVESLIYSYVLYLREGQTDRQADNPNWQRILTLPFEITQKPGGATVLARVLNEVGPLLGTEKLPMLDALARYYITAGADPMLAEKYAAEAERVLSDFKTSQSVLRVESTCVLAIAYSRESKNAAARDKSAECLKLARETGNDQSMVYAQAANIMVQAQTGNFAAAKDSLEALAAKMPENAETLVELAMSLASAKLYAEATSQLDSAIKRLLATGQKKSAAEAYGRTAVALASDSSDAGKKLRLEYLNAARELYHEVGAEPEEAETLIVLGDYFLGEKKPSEAIENYRRAQAIAETSGQQNIIGQAFIGLGNCYQAEQEFGKAADFHDKAARVFHELGNNLGETNSLRNLGRDAYEIGDFDKALSALSEAQKTAANTGTLTKYLAAYFLGDFYRSQGQYEKAFSEFREAVEVTSRDGDEEHSAYSHLAIAGVDGVVGSWEDAINESEAALSLFEKVGSKDGQADCWAELTSIYSDRTSAVKDFAKAKQAYQKAVDLGYGSTLQLALLEIDLQTGEYRQAAEIARNQIRDCSKETGADCRADALISLSEAERSSGNLKASRLALNEAQPLASKSKELYERGRFLYQRSRLLASEGKLSDALASYEEVISLIETVRGKLNSEEQKTISENYGFIYDELVSLLYSMSKKTPKDQFGLASKALTYAERNKARQFAESWGRAFKTQMRTALPATIQERELALYTERNSLMAKLEDATDSSSSASQTKVTLERNLASVQDQIRAFVQELRKSSPQYAAVAYPEDVDIATLPLRKGEMLVEFKMTEEATVVWVIENPEGIKNELASFYQIPVKRTWFLDRVSAVRNSLNAGHPEAVDWKVCDELFHVLFPDKIGKLIAAAPEITFIPDDVLFVLPFELFSPDASNGDFLLLKKPTTYYPSAVSLRLARTVSHPAKWQSAFLGIADPITSPEDQRFEVAQTINALTPRASDGGTIGDQNQASSEQPTRLKSRGFSFERLPGTATEVQSIAALLRERKQSVEVRFGVDATKPELLDTDLSKYRFLHFATHGVLPVDTGIREPSLVLSYDGVKAEDMFLSMSEILRLRLQSESVVLSACNTGSGKISRAEGVMSLGRAFLAAGASSVTASLWQVSDESTALLMENYYKGLLDGKRKSVALAEAREAVYSSGSRDPFFWAPFIVIGE